MKFPSVDDQMAVLTRGCDRIYSEDGLRQRLAQSIESGLPLRVKLGIDPTAPDIHLGHSVVLRKLRQFQDMGHKAVLVIGDFTAGIGDPSGRDKTRPMLSHDKAVENARTILTQSGLITITEFRNSPGWEDRSEPIEYRNNSEWLSKLGLSAILQLLNQMTVAQMLDRDSFSKRFHSGVPIGIHEFLYPLMQGYDSVVVSADIELGGTDQTFNCLVGRDMQRARDQKPQVVMTMPLLVGMDGAKKMSKTLGNSIGVTDNPIEMFSRIMSIPDSLMPSWFELLTDWSNENIGTFTDSAMTHPRAAKAILGRYIVGQFHSTDIAEAVSREFDIIHRPGEHGRPDTIAEVVALEYTSLDNGDISVVRLAIACGFASTNAEAKRLIREGGFRLNNEMITDPHAVVPVKDGDILQRGKRRFVTLRLIG